MDIYEGRYHMKSTAIIYQSKYGSTRKYAEWIYEAIGGDLYKKSEISINKLKQYDVIIYGGGLYLWKILGFSFIKNNYKYLEGKEIVTFSVGVSPFDTGIIYEIKENNFPEEMRYIPCFYLRGSFDKCSITLKDKIIINILIKIFYNDKENKQYEEWEKLFLDSMNSGGDWSSKEYLKPILDYMDIIYKR